MKTNIKATSISLTPAISEYVEIKVNSLEKFFQNTNADEVLVNVEVARTTRHHKSGDIFRAEIQIKSSGQEYYASADKDDLYAAIDEVKDEIVRSVTSRRKKFISFVRRGGLRAQEIIKNVDLRPWKKWKWRQ